MIVCINKIDSIDFSQNIFNKIKDEIINKAIKKVGYRPKNTAIIPICNQSLENYFEKINWYKEKILLQALDSYMTTPFNYRGNLDKPFRMAIRDDCNQ